jgi:hypothetical protein
MFLWRNANKALLLAALARLIERRYSSRPYSSPRAIKAALPPAAAVLTDTARSTAKR